MAAAWIKTQQLGPPFLQQLQTIYGEQHFPIEVRHYLADWIDSQNWSGINPENQFHEPAIKDLMSRFIRQIEEKANSSFNETDQFVTKLKFTKIADEYKRRFQVNPVGLFRLVRNCLLNEMNLIQQNDTAMLNSPVDVAYPYENPHFATINQRIDALKQQTQDNSDIIENFRCEEEQFQIRYSRFQEINERLKAAQSQSPSNSELHLQQLGVNDTIPADHRFLISKLETQRRQLEFELRDKVSTLTKIQFVMVENLKEISESVRTIISSVLDKELIDWKRQQQLAPNGSDFDTSHLDILQTWCEGLAEIIWISLTKVKEATRITKRIAQISNDMQLTLTTLYDLNKTFTEHLTTIVLNTFILEKQPPQVMKTNTRFSAKVRFLVGGKLNIHMNPPQVKVSIISEAQANLLLSEKQMRGEASGEILNNTGAMEYDATTKQLSITFRNMQLKKIKRAEKKGSESVVDEKFSLFFSSKFTIAGELEFGVWTMSLPVTVIVHGNQEPHAWATITWDNAFAIGGRRPFVVPDKVTWGKVATALNRKFHAVTGRPLSKEHEKYLAEKIFRCKFTGDEFETTQVSWSLFSKESLADRSFTFWDWFFAVMKLTKEHLKPLWTDGHILGFLKKEEAEKMLSNCPSGTFLLRFSDSELGGITIAWVAGTDDQKQVTMLQPFTAKDFAIRSLADRLYDLQHLLFLYPDIPKDKAFSRHYTPVIDTQTPSSVGYVKTLLITTVPGVSWPTHNNADNSARMNNGFNSYPTTPIIPPSSPDAHSTMSEPIGGGGWADTFTTMDYENINNLNDFTDFSALQDPPMTDAARALSNYD